jgi:hypothetical protein
MKGRFFGHLIGPSPPLTRHLTDFALKSLGKFASIIEERVVQLRAGGRLAFSASSACPPEQNNPMQSDLKPVDSAVGEGKSGFERR